LRLLLLWLLVAPAAAELRLEVNIPAFTLRLYDGAQVVLERPVTIGEPDHPTPRGEWELDRLVWNPDWVPPPSAETDASGPVPPGPNNPMGSVKLPLEAPYYIHGTRERGELGQPTSLGCIRLADGDARALARALQQRLLSPERVARIRQVRQDRPEQPLTVRLPRGVPVEVRYQPLAVDGRSAILYPDVYDRMDNPRRYLQRALSQALEVAPGELTLHQGPLLERLEAGWAHPLRFALDIDRSDVSTHSVP